MLFIFPMFSLIIPHWLDIVIYVALCTSKSLQNLIIGSIFAESWPVLITWVGAFIFCQRICLNSNAVKMCYIQLVSGNAYLLFEVETYFFKCNGTGNVLQIIQKAVCHSSSIYMKVLWGKLEEILFFKFLTFSRP